jgi:hypothetical protein
MKRVEYLGFTFSLQDWAKALRIPYATLQRRYQVFTDVQQAKLRAQPIGAHVRIRTLDDVFMAKDDEVQEPPKEKPQEHVGAGVLRGLTFTQLTTLREQVRSKGLRMRDIRMHMESDPDFAQDIYESLGAKYPKIRKTNRLAPARRAEAREEAITENQTTVLRRAREYTHTLGQRKDRYRRWKQYGKQLVKQGLTKDMYYVVKMTDKYIELGVFQEDYDRWYNRMLHTLGLDIPKHLKQNVKAINQ